VTKRLWFDLSAVRHVADHAASCDTFPGYGDYGREPCLLVQTTFRGRIGSNGRSQQPTPDWVRATHVDGGTGERWDRPTPSYYLRLTHAEDDDEPTLLDMLRASNGMCWFTIDVHPGSIAYAVHATREATDLPAHASWVPALVAAGDLGPYPAQIAHGYRRPGGGVFARVTRDVAWWIALDLRHLPAGQRPAEAIQTTGDRVVRIVDQGSDHERVEPLTADPGGWWRIDGDAWPWTPVDTDNADTDSADNDDAHGGLFQSWGPDGEQERCTVCHAINDIDYDEMPSMVGYGHDTATRCRRCGSTETTDRMFGARTRRAPWPPPRARQDELDRPNRPHQRQGPES
jgi:hypothetical protein